MKKYLAFCSQSFNCKQTLVVLLCFFVLNVYAAFDLNRADIMTVSKDHPSFTIDLSANATTGYRWVLGKHDPLIRLVSATYYPNSNKALMGAPGHTIWIFHVSPAAFTGAHAMTLELLYERPWNHERAAKRLFCMVTD